MTDTAVHLRAHNALAHARGDGVRWLDEEPYYVAAGDEVQIFEQCHGRGLPDSLLAAAPERCLRIPMVPGARSLNLATAAGVALYEALRQTGAPPG